MYLLVLSENYKTSLHSRTTVFPGFAGTFSFEARLTPLNLALLEKREKQRFNEFCHSPFLHLTLPWKGRYQRSRGMSCISSVEDWYKALFINTQYDFALLEEPFHILKCYEYCTPFPATAESRYSFPAGAGQSPRTRF